MTLPIQSAARSIVDAAVFGQIGAAPPSQAMTNLTGAIGAQMLGQYGMNAGYPPPIIAQAQNALQLGIGAANIGVAAAVGKLGEKLGLNAYDTGALLRSVNAGIDSKMKGGSGLGGMANQALREAGDRAMGGMGSAGRYGGGGFGMGIAGGMNMGGLGMGGGGGILLRIASAMGKVLDQKMNEMASLTDQMSNLDSQSSQYGEITSRIQALGQLTSMISNALKSSIDSLGEASSSLARKG